MIWISFVFLQGDRILENTMLKPYSSHELWLDLNGIGIGYYKILMPEFKGEQLFVQILDKNNNIISEQSIQTKMSVGYFDFDSSGTYTMRVSNHVENQVNLQVEFGNTSSEEMTLPGILTVVGAIIILFSAYIKLKNYKIEQPDKNIS